MEINGEQVNGTKTYAELGLSEAIMRAIEKKGYVQATPVQAGAIPYFMEWKDVIAKAPTGTGKTFAFGIPMVEHIDPECADVQGLVLAPTRELAVQIQEELRDLCEFKEGVRTVCLYGGAPIDKQINTLKKRPQIVVGNKCDLATEEQIESFRSYVEGKGLTFVPISAATMQGVRELPGLVYNRLKDIPPVPVFTPEYKKPEPKANDRAYTIQRMEAHVWSIDAPWLEYILAGSNVDDYESLQYFQRQLDESGILTELVEKGVQENDTILIGEYQFDYIF